ncbi:MAG: molybdopterin-dependent oxidoreductase [Bradymonadaceae bacterium]|nr:molybdopterin-dependent oxidoreductase [Lujinxingiaceae bacterium]
MKHYDAILHVRGESEYVDDVTPPAGMLHAAVFASNVAHGRIVSLDLEAARASDGVVAILTASDIPGANQIGGVIEDEALLAEGHVHFQGEPVALVVAESFEQALKAVAKIKMEVELGEIIVDPRVAFEKGEVIGVPRTFEMGDVEAAWAACDVVIEGRSDVAGQEHLYLETQRARAVPSEGGRLRVYSSTQGPYAVQKTVAKVLGVPHHVIEVDVRRLGGGFGGKEDQATAWGCLAALAAWNLKRPVELVLNRIDDLKMTGKRHPYSADYKIGATKDGKILAYAVRHYQNAGAACDLSLAVLERTLFHSTNAYNIANVRAFAASCRTNLPPNTAFRGFGGPQGMFAIESALTEVAEALGTSREEIQYRNLISDGDMFPYGQEVEHAQAQRTWEEAIDSFDYAGMRRAVDKHNATNTATKKGLAIMPICFGISFTATFLNQASALLHIYTDGSVSISTGGVEMGQGINTKIINIAAKALGIRESRIFVESTNTSRIANMSPSAASATTDLNGGATILAAGELMARFRTLMAQEFRINDPGTITIVDEQVLYRGEATGWDWEKLVNKAYMSRIALSSHAFYATPNVWFDKTKEKGRPFAYHAYGTAIIQVTLDCLRGIYDFDTVRIVHDLGRPINELVDLGQIEGGLAQGLGWMTLEELAYNDQGRLLSHALSTYKAPDGFFMPDDIQVILVEDSDNESGPYGSKAVGEPPLMYGIGAFFAIREAVRAYTGGQPMAFDAPLTPEKALLALHADKLGGLSAKRTAKSSVSAAIAAAVVAVIPGK